MVGEAANIQRTVLPNGLTIITEEMEHIRSVSIGIWIKSGSRDEEPAMRTGSRTLSSTWFSKAPHRSAEGHRAPSRLHRRQHGRVYGEGVHLLQHEGAGRASALAWMCSSDLVLNPV